MLPTNNFEIINVIIKLIIPCNSFIIEYFVTDILCLLVKEVTCAIIDIPEKEHKKLIMLNFNGNDRVDVAKRLHPFVISTLPRIIAYREP